MPRGKAGVCLEKGVAVVLRLLLCQFDAVACLGVLAEPRRPHAIQEAEVERLRKLPVLLRHVLDAKHHAGRANVQVFAALVSGEHVFVAGQLGRNAQLDLRIVRLDQHVAGGSAETLAIGWVAWQVLQVGIGATHSTAGGADLLPTGVHTVILGDVLGPVSPVSRATLVGIAVLPE